jgi:topoisomerase-4 subunit A
MKRRRFLLIAASDGRGFIVSQDEMAGTTRKGKLLLNVEAPAQPALILPVEGDHIAIIGENRRMLIFPLSQIPEMARGKGVKLQKYHDGGCVDAKIFNLAEGLSWKDSAGRSFKLEAAELRDWIGNRADIGRLPPRGFPKNNRFA